MRDASPPFLAAVLDGPLTALRPLPGSGAAQAPPLAQALCAAGLRASDQSGPPGVAVYLDSSSDVPLAKMAAEEAILWLMCGLAAEQAQLEAHYAEVERRPLLVARFRSRLAQIATVQSVDIESEPLREAMCPLGGRAGPADGGDDSDSEPPPKAARLQPPAWSESEAALEACVAGVTRRAAPLLGVSELQLEREWRALLCSHSSLANACLARVLLRTGVHVQDATLLPSARPARVRLLLQLYDAVVDADQQRPRAFAWVPSLGLIVRGATTTTTTTTTTTSAASGATGASGASGTAAAADGLAREMSEAVWAELVRGGFWPSASLRAALAPLLDAWLASCLRLGSGGAGVPLRAAVVPTAQLALYLHGAAGSGKSSFVRALLPALAAALRRHLDPGLQAAAVKQTLNKDLPSLRLEFERRPNNNDLSVRTIVEMAREPLSAGAEGKPRLMILGLEEMPPAPLEVARLLGARFGTALAHADLLPVFTSNYALAPDARAALAGARTFANLHEVAVQPPVGDERAALAEGYLTRQLGAARRALGGGGGGGGTGDDVGRGGSGGGGDGDGSDGGGVALPAGLRLELALRLDEGDVRPLVRRLRTVAVYAADLLRRSDQQLRCTKAAMAANATAIAPTAPPRRVLCVREAAGCAGCAGNGHGGVPGNDGGIELELRADGEDGEGGEIGRHELRLQLSPHRNLLPADGRLLHATAAPLRSALLAGGGGGPPGTTTAELAHVLDLWMCGALAPAVVVCTDGAAATRLLDTLSNDPTLAGGAPPSGCAASASASRPQPPPAAAAAARCAFVRDVDPLVVKMNRALYERRDASRSLRDELLDAREGAAGAALAAVELRAPSAAAQLLIREIVEDTPSVVAHSVHRRILHKRGLLFVVRVDADADADADADGATAAVGGGAEHAAADEPPPSPAAVTISPELASRASLIW